MPQNSTRDVTTEWAPRPIVDWLLGEGRFVVDLDELARQLGNSMLAHGVPLFRLRISMRTLHPLVAAVSSVWERDVEATIRIESSHGLEGRSGYLGSPLEIITRTGAPFRKRLGGDLTATDHTVLHDLKARGGTDYFGLPLTFSDGPAANVVFMTDTSGGFSDREIDGLTEIASVLAPIVELFRSKLVSLAVAEAYLGRRTAQRVLQGQITRGNIEKINAAILMSDIRDWTGLNNRVSADEALGLANRYFEVVGEAVEENGGVILKFMGDGVLAIFPTDDGTEGSGEVCERALTAAKRALHLARSLDPPLALNFGIGMHFGEVLYGNVGSRNRLDFTVMGHAVNTAARIEGLCDKLGQSILFSRDFGEQLTEPTMVVADETLKGHRARTSILSLRP